jgi:hypothetical protein
MVESLTSITITAVAGAALLTSAAATVQSTTQLADRTVARGLADQLMDEVAAVRFPDGTVPAAAAGSPRSAFRTIDDFASYSVQPPVDRYNRTIGTEGAALTGSDQYRPTPLQPSMPYVNEFRQQVLVERVQPSGSTWTAVSQNTNYRRATVTITRTDANGITVPLATAVRIFSSIAPTP